MKYATTRPYAHPEKAVHRILEIANAIEPVQAASTSRTSTSRFCFATAAAPAEHGAGLKLAIERGWLKMHEVRDFRYLHAGRRPAVRLTSKERPKNFLRLP